MDALSSFLSAAERFGAAAPVIGLLLWLYWLERSERRELSAKLIEITKEQISAEEEMTSALNMLTAKVTR